MYRMFDLDEWNRSQNDYVGIMTWWTIHEATVSVEDVQQNLLLSGFTSDDVKKLVREPSVTTVMRRAGRAIEKTHDHRIARVVSRKGEKLVMGVVEEDVDEQNQQLGYNHDTTMTVEKRSKEFRASGALAREAMQQIDYFKDSITERDVQTLLRRIVGLSWGVSMRPTGGIYFVPRGKVQGIFSADDFLRRMGLGYMIFMRVPDGDCERAAAWESAKREVKRQTNSISEAAAKIEKKPSFLVKQKDRLTEVSKLLDFFADLTVQKGQFGEFGDLDDQIKKVEHNIEKKMEVMAAR